LPRRKRKRNDLLKGRAHGLQAMVHDPKILLLSLPSYALKMLVQDLRSSERTLLKGLLGQQRARPRDKHHAVPITTVGEIRIGLDPLLLEVKGRATFRGQKTLVIALKIITDRKQYLGQMLRATVRQEIRPKLLGDFHHVETKVLVEMKAMTKFRFVVGLMSTLLLASCDGERMYEDFHAFDQGGWEVSDTVAFDLGELDSITGQSLVAVRFTEDFPFSNMYIKLIYRDSSKLVLRDTVWNVPIFDTQSGKPLGKGFGNTYTTYDTLPFTIPTKTKEVLLLQYMRQAELLGVEAVGIKVLRPEIQP
jgi:gliding motility-associated lipoprotein GldH